MNKNIENAILDLDKVDGIMYAIENSYLDIEVSPESMNHFNHGVSTFYALWDAIHKVAEDLERLSSDEMVVDAIYAVNDIQRQKRILTYAGAET